MDPRVKLQGVESLLKNIADHMYEKTTDEEEQETEEAFLNIRRLRTLLMKKSRRVKKLFLISGGCEHY